MNKSALLLLILSIILSAQAGVFNAVGAVTNNSDTDYVGVHRAIKAHSHIFAINPMGLPVELKPEHDYTKPSFTIRQIETTPPQDKSVVYPRFTTFRTYMVTDSTGKSYAYTIMSHMLTWASVITVGGFVTTPFILPFRRNIAITINKDYTILLSPMSTNFLMLI